MLSVAPTRPRGAPRPRASAVAWPRLLAILTPVLTWVAVTAPAWAAVVAPAALGFFLVAFAAYWLWRSAEFVVGAALGVWRLRVDGRRDWAAEAAALPGFDRLRHVVIIPTYRESEAILADTLRHLAAQTVPLDRLTVVLAFEERDPDAAARAQLLSARFRPLFERLLVTVHPDLPGEVKGKSANLAWAARRVQSDLRHRGGDLSPRDLLVTVGDADSRLHPQYLAGLSHAVLSHPEGWQHVYQPTILFYANHARLPLPMRAISSVFSLYSLARLAASHRIVPQSTYSLSWEAAEAVDFWDVDVIPEDSHMFFKLWLHLGRAVRARPIYLPVLADAAEGATLWRALGNHYRQIRRWAWGVSDVPYLVTGALRARHIPWYTRVARVGWYVEDHLVWPSHWFLLTLGGVLPRLLNPQYAATDLATWQAGAVSALLAWSTPALVVGLAADALLRPRSRARSWVVDLLGSVAGFATLPVTGLVLSALPALDAHTRLLFGRSLAYQVTEKRGQEAEPGEGDEPRPAASAPLARREAAYMLRDVA